MGFMNKLYIGGEWREASDGGTFEVLNPADESVITKNEAIILSMTKKERENPKIINGSRKKRIAIGSGTDVATINKLIKQFKMMSEMMKKMSKGNLKGMSDKGIPPELFLSLIHI